MNVSASPSRRGPLGLPFSVVLGLALLGAPRVVVHDLGIAKEGTFLNLLLVAIPPVVWIAVTVLARVPNPFLTLLVIGACYGVLLAGIHQVLWDQAFSGSPPAIGGNLSGIDLQTRQSVTRVAAVVSSLFTGVAVGALLGLVALAVRKIIDRTGAQRSPAGPGVG